LAVEQGKGLMFWNYELAARKRKCRIRTAKNTYERRYICPDCVSYVLADVAGSAEAEET
jgi:hypothetical protein